MATHVDIALDGIEDLMPTRKSTVQPQQLQQQQQSFAGTPRPPVVRIELRAMEDSPHRLPARRRTPRFLPPHAPLPRKGEIVYVTSTSAWQVALVIHEWLSPDELQVLVMLDHAGATHHGGRSGFASTQ